MTVTITELENGWYSLPLSTAHTDTLGVLSVSLSAAGAKRVNLVWRVAVRITDDLAFPNVSGRGVDVDATGGVEITPNQNVNVNQWLTATPAALNASGHVLVDVRRWIDVAVNALIAGRVDASVGAMASAVLTASAIATDAIDNTKIAAGAITSSEAPNLDAAVSSRAAPGAAMALITDALDSLAVAASGANEIADALLDRASAVEGFTPRQLLRLFAAVLVGKANGLETTTAHYRDVADTKDRILATVDANGNRSAVTRDAT